MKFIQWTAPLAALAVFAGGCRQQTPSAQEQAAVEQAAAAQAASPAADGTIVDPAVVAAAEARATEAEARAAAAEAEAKAVRSEARAAAAEARAAEARAARSEARRTADAAKAYTVAAAPTAPVREVRATPAPTPDPIVIPGGTQVSLVLETPLSTETNRLEDRVDASLNEDIRVDGKVVVPAGTSFRGYISQIQRSGKIGGRAALGVQFTSFRLSGRQYAIDATTIGLQGKGSKKDAAVIGGGTAGGAVIGGIVGGKKGAIIGGILGGATGTVVAAKDRDDVEVTSGTVWQIELTAPVTIQ